MLWCTGVAVGAGNARYLSCVELAVWPAGNAQDLVAGVFDGAGFVANDVAGLGSDDAFDGAQRCCMENEIRLCCARKEMNVGIVPADFLAQQADRAVAETVGAIARKAFVIRRFKSGENGWNTATVVIVVESDHGGLLLLMV